METVKHRQCGISVQAKAKNFDLKIKVSSILPFSRFFETRFAILLKLRRFLLKVNSEIGEPEGRRRRRRETLKSKFLRNWKKLRVKRFKNNVFAGKKNSGLGPPEIHSQGKRSRRTDYEESISSTIAGHFALLSRSISKKDQRGIITHAFALLFYLSFLIKNFISRKCNLSIILVAFIACLIGFSLNYVSHV